MPARVQEKDVVGEQHTVSGTLPFSTRDSPSPPLPPLGCPTQKKTISTTPPFSFGRPTARLYARSFLKAVVIKRQVLIVNAFCTWQDRTGLSYDCFLVWFFFKATQSCSGELIKKKKPLWAEEAAHLVALGLIASPGKQGVMAYTCTSGWYSGDRIKRLRVQGHP